MSVKTQKPTKLLICGTHESPKKIFLFCLLTLDPNYSSMDIGLTLISAKTGKEVVFYIDEVIERQGEIDYWIFCPFKKSPELGNLSIVIYND